MSLNRETEPPPKMWERAAEIWRRLLEKPVYDNLGDQPARIEDFFAQSLVDKLPKNATPERLAAFKAALLERFLDTSRDLFTRAGTHVDYGPDGLLRGAAEAVGLVLEFPWKTSVWVSDTYVSVRAGYGAESVYHYPLENGWLVTRLSGSDISLVIEYVNGGSPDFLVEND